MLPEAAPCQCLEQCVSCCVLPVWNKPCIVSTSRELQLSLCTPVSLANIQHFFPPWMVIIHTQSQTCRFLSSSFFPQLTLCFFGSFFLSVPESPPPCWWTGPQFHEPEVTRLKNLLFEMDTAFIANFDSRWEENCINCLLGDTGVLGEGEAFLFRNYR